MRPTLLLLLVPLLLGLSIAPMARGEGPADELLRLVPPEAAATLAVEDLRDHARELLGSPLAAGLRRLPAVEAWFRSDRRRDLERARGEIETALGVTPATVRDELLGDAVVLALVIEDDPEEGKGLLLVRVRDEALLRRLVETINRLETQGGKLAEQARRTWHGAPYTARTFRPGTRPPDYYARLGTTFAWSNSEAMIRGVLDRKAGRTPGLGDDPKFRAVRRGLPEGAIASLFVDPRFLERRLAADTRPKEPGEARALALIGRGLAAVRYAGAALEWRDGFILHTHEAIDPSKVDEPLRRWASRPGSTAALVGRVPATALALAAGHFDFGAIHDALIALVPDPDRGRVDNATTVLRGLLLGKDLRMDVLPQLGPGALLYADAPEAGSELRLPTVLAVELSESASDRGVPAALDNALRTILALYALDPKVRDLGLRVGRRESGGVRLTTLGGARTRLAYAIERGCLVVGTSADAVSAYCTAAPGASGGSRFERLRAAYFPGVESFAYVDLPRLVELAGAHRDAIARHLAAKDHRPDADARRDLDQALALLGLFRGGFATCAIAADVSSVHRTLGLIAREPESPPNPPAEAPTR